MSLKDPRKLVVVVFYGKLRITLHILEAIEQLNEMRMIRQSLPLLKVAEDR